MRDCHCFMAAPTKIRILIAFAALYLVWGSTYLGIRFAIESIPPFLMAGMRFLLAGVIMFAIAWSQGAYKSSWASWRVSLIVGACLLLAGNGGVTISEQYIDTGLAALIVAIVPIYIVILGWATGITPRPLPIIWLGLVGGFAGVGVLLASSASPCKRWTTSRDRDVHSARVLLCLVGRITLFAHSETRCLSISDGRPTDALRRTAPFACRYSNWRVAKFSSAINLDVVPRFIHLSGIHRSCGWIHRLHLAVASL